MARRRFERDFSVSAPVDVVTAPPNTRGQRTRYVNIAMRWIKLLCTANALVLGACNDGQTDTDGGADVHASCGVGAISCSGVCVSPQTDNQNCGACGAGCASGEVCSQGTCAPSCGGGTTRCGSICADTLPPNPEPTTR